MDQAGDPASAARSTSSPSYPNLNAFTASVNASFDTVSNRRWTVDVGRPLIRGDLGFLLSYSGGQRRSYFYGHYMRKNAVYGAVRWRPNGNYQLDFNTEINAEQYTENVGINPDQPGPDRPRDLSAGRAGRQRVLHHLHPAVRHVRLADRLAR